MHFFYQHFDTKMRPKKLWNSKTSVRLSLWFLSIQLNMKNGNHSTGSRSTFEFPSRSTFPVPVCTLSSRHWVNKAGTHIGLAGATRLTRLNFRLNLLLLKGQRCLIEFIFKLLLKLFVSEQLEYTQDWINVNV